MLFVIVFQKKMSIMRIAIFAMDAQFFDLYLNNMP